MPYYSSRYSRRHSTASGAVLKTGSIVLCLLGLFAFGIWRFRFAPKVEASSQEVSDAAVLTPAPVSSSAIAAIDTNSGDAVLHDVSGGSASARAHRSNEDGRFTLKMEATLPEIDRDAFAYEGWLVRQVPYDYVSVGDFVTDENGDWVLEWAAASGTYDSYARLVVTLEPKDNNPDPSGHVLEGEFE